MNEEPRPHFTRTSLAWQVYFGVSLFFTVTGFLAVFAIPNLSFFDLIDFIVSLIAFVGLYGFVFQQAIGKVLYWRYFVYVFLIESIFFCLVLPLVGIDRYGQDFQLDGSYLFELAYVIIMLRAQQLYAFRRPNFWRRPLSKQ